MDINIKALILLDKVVEESKIDINETIRNKIINISNIIEQDISMETKEGIEMFIRDVKESSTIIDESSLKTFQSILRTVNWEENDNLVVVKYNKNIFNYGWNKLAKSSRGKIIDIENKVIVSHAFNKFFNMGEVEETEKERVKQLISEERAKITVMDKKDGTTIIVTKYKGKILINTNGSLRSDPIVIAKELFQKKYSYFISNIKEGFTYVFELIHPSNIIVIDYKDEEALYLLAVRDLRKGVLLEYSEAKNIASAYKLDIVEQEEDLSIFNIIEKGSKVKVSSKVEKEGWVIRVITETEDLMFKVKLEDYLELAKLREKVSLKYFYTLYIEEKIDDLLVDLEEDMKKEIQSLVSEVEAILRLIEGEIRREVKRIELEYNLTEKTFTEPNNRSKMIEAIQSIENSVINNYVIGVLKRKYNIEDIFNPLPDTRKFSLFVEYLNGKDEYYFDLNSVRVLT